MKPCRCDAYKFPHRFGGGACHGPFLCVHGVDLEVEECLDCIIDEHEHPDEDQAPCGYRPRFLSMAYWEDNPAAVRY